MSKNRILRKDSKSKLVADKLSREHNKLNNKFKKNLSLIRESKACNYCFAHFQTPT